MMKISNQLHALTVVLSRDKPRYICVGGWVDAREGLDVVEDKLCHESNPGSSSPWPGRYIKLRLGIVHLLLVRTQKVL
jgi:hypothetical protein